MTPKNGLRKKKKKTPLRRAPDVGSVSCHGNGRIHLLAAGEHVGARLVRRNVQAAAVVPARTRGRARFAPKHSQVEPARARKRGQRDRRRACNR
jgi:hypothetical protein